MSSLMIMAEFDLVTHLEFSSISVSSRQQFTYSLLQCCIELYCIEMYEVIQSLNMHSIFNQLQVKNRSRRLTKLFRSYASYDHLVGSIQTVLVTERSHDSQYYVGHTKCYEQVSVYQHLIL